MFNNSHIKTTITRLRTFQGDNVSRGFKGVLIDKSGGVRVTLGYNTHCTDD